MNAHVGFGVDLGGTTCKLGLFDADGSLLENWEIPTDTTDNGGRILPDIAEAIRGKLSERQIPAESVLGIGIGVPGAVDRAGTVNRCVNLGWGVVPVAQELNRLTGLRVLVGNDASVAALGESWKGSGAGHDSVVLLTLGTGIGGGIVLDGRLVNGFHGAAGEFGHILADPDETEACSCGKRGCIEQYASATGIVRYTKRVLNQTQLESTLRTQPNFTAKDVLDAAKAGDPAALTAARAAFEKLGTVIAGICNAIDPEVVLLGGGVSRAGEILLALIRPTFEQAAFHACRDTKILLATLGNDAGIYGGMKLLLNDL